jgi:hypothetical protein
MINKVATTHCSFLRRQIKREDISTNAMSVTKTELYTILRDVCIVSRDVCIVSNRLTCIVAVVRDSRADVELATSLEDRRSQQYTWRDIVECVLVFIFLFITAVFW